MKAGDIMTRRIIAIHDDAPIDEAVRLMLKNDVSGLPVVDRAGGPVGIVTEGDLLRRVETATEIRRPRWLEILVGPGRLAEEYVQAHGRRVSEVMTRDLVSVGESDDLSEVVRIMERRRVKRVLVLRDGALVGLIARGNLLQAFSQHAPDPTPAQQSDQAISAEIAKALAGLKWRPHATINPIVRDGAVYLHGTIFDEREGEALRVLCENIPGVKEVHDRLVSTEAYY